MKMGNSVIFAEKVFTDFTLFWNFQGHINLIFLILRVQLMIFLYLSTQKNHLFYDGLGKKYFSHDIIFIFIFLS